MTTYSGYHDIKAGSTKPRSIEEVTEQVDHMDATTGRPFTHKNVKAARAAVQRMNTLRAARGAVLAKAEAALDAAGQAFAEGKAEAEEVASLAHALATTRANDTDVSKFLDGATHGTNMKALSLVAAIGDAWLDPIKARAVEILAEANVIADRLDIDPTPQTLGVVRAEHHWTPSRHDLEHNLTLRHDWEKLEEVLLALDMVHSLADELRNMGLVACVEGRDHAEDYRWRLADRLSGDPAMVREFFLANRATAEPGVYSAADLAGTAAPRVREQGIDKFSRSDEFTQAHLDDDLDRIRAASF